MGAAAFAFYSAAMATGRLTGDRLTAAFGAPVLVRAGGILSAAGLTAGAEPKQAARQLDHADELLAQSTGSAPSWVAYFDAAEHAGARVVSARDLTHPDHRGHPASPHFETALRLRAPGFDRVRTMDRIGLAAARLDEDQPERAAAAGQGQEANAPASKTTTPSPDTSTKPTSAPASPTPTSSPSPDQPPGRVSTPSAPPVPFPPRGTVGAEHRPGAAHSSWPSSSSSRSTASGSRRGRSLSTGWEAVEL